MKNKKILITAIMSLALLFPVTAKATTGVSINCPSKTIARGATMTCSVVANVDDKLVNVGFNYSTDGPISISKINVDDSKWSSVNRGDGKITVSASSVIDSGTPAGDMVISASADAENGSTATISLSNIVVGHKASADEQNDTSDNVNDVTETLTIGESSGNENGNGDGSGNPSTNSNPKTMDTNVVIITLIVSLAAGVVIIGKKKLDKISK